jgi:uncharacterized protein Veg
MENEKILEKLKKLINLKNKDGNENEKNNADKLIRTLCSKYKIDIDSLTDDKKELREFKCSNKNELTVIFHAIQKALNNPTIEIYKDNRRRKWRFVKLTNAEYIYVSQFVDFYLRRYKKELSKIEYNFTVGFVYKNSLYLKTDKEPEKSDHDSDLDFDLMSSLIPSMSDDPFYKSLKQ